MAAKDTPTAAGAALHDSDLLRDVTLKEAEKFLSSDSSDTCKQCVLYRSLRALREDVAFYSKICLTDVSGGGHHRLPICEVFAADAQRACTELVDVSANFMLCSSVDAKCSAADKKKDSL